MGLPVEVNSRVDDIENSAHVDECVPNLLAGHLLALPVRWRQIEDANEIGGRRVTIQ